MNNVSNDAWSGRYFEDIVVGDVYRSRLGRTITDADNVWFTCLTMNSNQIHFNSVYASRTGFERCLVNSTLTLAIVVGLSVADTSENGGVNLAWDDIRLPSPVYVGDTIWAETEVLAKRESASRPDYGIVSIRSRGINQEGRTVCEYLRTFMLPRQHASVDAFPNVDAPWGVTPNR